MDRWVLRTRALLVIFVAVVGSACESTDQPTRCVPGVTCSDQPAGMGGMAGLGSAAGSGTGGSGGPSAGATAAGMGGMTAGAAGGGTGGSTPIGGAGAAGSSMPVAGSGAAGSAGSNMPMAGSGAAGGAGTSTAGSGGTPASDDEFEAVRQVCLDTINMYRATEGLMALKRATAEQETCSDMGAKLDGDSGDAHGSAGMCQLGSQNACPGYPLRIGGGTVEGTLKYCLMQMWGEGEPPEGVAACKADRSGCYLKYGHWINMVDPNIRVVGCGFYKMANGSYWMNQNFGR